MKIARAPHNLQYASVASAVTVSTLHAYDSHDETQSMILMLCHLQAMVLIEREI